MKLSICMMVKDEERNLSRCLDSLKPLMEALDSELIIVDTGSTDQTVEIANRYTNRIYLHPWENDFSKMRNRSIQYAKGQWILIIDADEEMEDCSEIIGFLNDTDAEGQFNTAAITVHNVIHEAIEAEQSIIPSPRLFRNDGSFHYKGTVHNIPVYKQPLIHLNTVLKHYGYLRTDPELMERKFQRTTRLLMAELEKDPGNIYYTHQLAVSYAMHNEPKKSIELENQAYERILSQKESPAMHMYVYAQQVKNYITCDEYMCAIDWCQKALEIVPGHIDFIYYTGYAHMRLSNFREAEKAYLEYLNKYQAMNQTYSLRNGLVSTDTLGFVDCVHAELAQIYFSWRRYHESLKHLDEVKSFVFIPNAMGLLCKTLFIQKEYGKVVDFYNRKAKESPKLMLQWAAFVEEQEILLKEDRDQFREIMTGCSGVYGKLYQCRKKLRNVVITKEDTEEWISESDFVKCTPRLLSDLVVYRLIAGDLRLTDIAPALLRVALIRFAETVGKEHFMASIKPIMGRMEDGINQARLDVMVKEVAWLQDKNDQNTFLSYLEAGKRYIGKKYSDTVLAGDYGLHMDSHEERFFYAMRKLDQHEKNYSQYVSELRQVLLQFPEMKHGIEMVLDRIKQQVDGQEKEYQELKNKVKEEITHHIHAGNYETAIDLINQYEEIEKNDFEVMMMKAIALIQQNELADAMSVFEQCNAAAIGHPDFWYNLAYCLELRNENVLAMYGYWRALKNSREEAGTEEIEQAIAGVRERIAGDHQPVLEIGDETEEIRNLNNRVLFSAIFEGIGGMHRYMVREGLSQNKINGNLLHAAHHINTRSEEKSFRVLHGTMEIANQMNLYSKALRKMDVFSETFNYFPNQFCFESDYSVPIQAVPETERPQVIREIAEKMISSHEIFHFHFNSTFTADHNDVSILRQLGKKALMNYWGSEARQLSLARSINPFIRVKSRDEEGVRRNLEAMGRLIDHAVVSDAEMHMYVKDWFKHVWFIPQAVDVEKYLYREGTRRDRPLIVHAPTSSEIKGTQEILTVLEKLKPELDFEFKLIQNMPHAEAMKIYADADLVIDSIREGAYGILALECMALGRPVIGWICDYMKAWYPKELPILSANPDTLEKQLRLIIKDADWRIELGRQGRKYVETHHSLEKVGKDLLALYRKI